MRKNTLGLPGLIYRWGKFVWWPDSLPSAERATHKKLNPGYDILFFMVYWSESGAKSKRWINLNIHDFNVTFLFEKRGVASDRSLRFP